MAQSLRALQSCLVGRKQQGLADPSLSLPAPHELQLMVKDSKQCATTGGWGFAHFKDGKPGEEALLSTCFPCHNPTKASDLIFTGYAP
jgi:hypothetical protein